MSTLDFEVRKPLILRVKRSGRFESYSVAYPLSAVAELEKTLGRNMRVSTGWFAMSPAELPEVLRVGLVKLHPKDAEAVSKEICDSLSPENVETVITALCAFNWPETTKRFQERVDKLTAALEKGLPLPNVPSVAAS